MLHVPVAYYPQCHMSNPFATHLSLWQFLTNSNVSKIQRFFVFVSNQVRTGIFLSLLLIFLRNRSMYCSHGPEVGPMWALFRHQVAVAAALSKYETYILQKQFNLASQR